MKKILFILFWVITCFISCHKSDTSLITSFNMSSYPVTVGNEWTYQVADNYGTVDTATFINNK